MMARAWKGALGALLCVALLVVPISATTFSVENRAPTTPGGKRYDTEMGDAWTVPMLESVATYVVNALAPSYVPRDHITFIVEDFQGAAYNNGNEVHIATDYLAGVTEDLRFTVHGLMFHEVCHSFQNFNGDYGTDKHFTGVIEGIATYMELVAGFGVGPKEKGGDWFAGYHATAHFFAWIDQTHVPNFVNKLNQRMGENRWNDNFFVFLTEKDVDTLWSLYQASF